MTVTMAQCMRSATVGRFARRQLGSTQFSSLFSRNTHIHTYTALHVHAQTRMSLDDDFAPVADRSRTLRTHFAAGVAEILDAEGDRADGRLPLTKAFAQQLAEVSWSWTTTALAPDLERFAKHAKRSKIAPEDVLLAARKNEVTYALIDREAQKLRSAAADAKRHKGGDTSAV